MDENKNEILEEGAEGLAEVTEETVEETVEEATEEVVEEAIEEAEEDSEEAEKYISTEMLLEEVIELRNENAVLRKANKVMKGVLTTIVAIALCVALVFAGMGVYKTVYNPYNHMGYYNISGMTLADAAEEYGMSLEDVIKQLNLPSDIQGNTYWDAVEFIVPVSYMAQLYGMDVDSMKETFGMGEEITGSSTWGEALDSMTLLSYMGSEETIEEFKAEYGYGDEITGETLWGEIRAEVNKIEYEKHLAQQATAVEEDITEAE